MRAVLLITVLMSLVYGGQVLVDIVRPQISWYPGRVAVSFLDGSLQSWWPAASFWSFVVGVPVAMAAALIGFVWSRDVVDPRVRQARTRRWQATVAVVLLLPYPWMPVETLASHPLAALLCVPGTAWALWLVNAMQRFRRMPMRLTLGVFLWGLLVGVGFGATIEAWWRAYAPYYLAPHVARPTDSVLLTLARQVYAGQAAFAGVFEELGKGAAIAIVYLLWRRHLDNVVSGIVLGAAVGLGFNLVESVSYMAADGRWATLEFFFRQGVGLLMAHAAFTAAIGAGFGIARQIRDRDRRILAITCGFAAAVAVHFANDALLPAYDRVENDWFAPTTTTQTLFFEPLSLLVLQGPMVVLYLVLLTRGLHDQSAGLAAELRREAATGLGAVTPPEVAALLHPARRFHLQLSALHSGGPRAWRDQKRLFAAQLDLGMTRWHRTRGDLPRDGFATGTARLPDEVLLRRRVAWLRHCQATRRTHRPVLTAGAAS